MLKFDSGLNKHSKRVYNKPVRHIYISCNGNIPIVGFVSDILYSFTCKDSVFDTYFDGFNLDKRFY